MTLPFKIESENINRLNDHQLTLLLKELLHAECCKFEIPQRSVEVALNIRAGDGGEDGRVSWSGGVEETDYIPNRLTIFQNKATDMGPSDYAKEIITASRKGASGSLKQNVEDVLSQSGSYIVFTTQELNKYQKENRISEIRNKLREIEKTYANSCDIRIYDASQIAGWVNNYISTIVSVQNWLGISVERGLKSFEQWKEYVDSFKFSFVSVESRKNILIDIPGKIINPKTCFRIIGLSGLGKTRTAFQIFEENEDLRSLVVYVDANYAPRIDALISDWISWGLKAIVVVDNCNYELHERLVAEVKRSSSRLSLLTLDYDIHSVGRGSYVYKLEAMTDSELMQLLSPVYESQLPDLYRIAAFAQGFPQMAVLLAEAKLSEDPKVGMLTEDDLAKKLLWRRDQVEDSKTLKILQALSLFDVFGVEKEVEKQLQYIASIIGIDIDSIYECVQAYSERGIIDRRGRFGQVVPKPLAIRLAGQWWSSSRSNTQKKLIRKLPNEMVEAFCRQVEKLDYHSNVKKMTEELCGPQGPFGQAEVILTDWGSRLFRSFVNVNPEVTCNALYHILKNFDQQHLHGVIDNPRRNLVWALERLCYHKNIFPRAAWCMLLLASAENESWSNNATGMFTQLFKVHYSGTEACLVDRLNIVRKALDFDLQSVDMVLLGALTQAVSAYGGGRSIGAEYQGTNPPLKDWKPETWEEIFDYWQESFKLLLIIFNRGGKQRDKVLAIIGSSIKWLILNDQINMLDIAIREIVASNGRYWPEALKTINSTFEYHSSELSQEAVDALNQWLELLSSDEAEIPEKLKILIINPPSEYKRDENGDYINIAAMKAKKLANEMSNNVDELIPYLRLLLDGEQRMSNVFGYHLVDEIEDLQRLITASFYVLKNIEKPDINFILGLYRKLFERSPQSWQEKIDLLLSDTDLIEFYPDFVNTGKAEKEHLDNILGLMRSEQLLPINVKVIGYGGVTKNIDTDILVDFCLKLSDIGDEVSWLALNIISRICFIESSMIEKYRRQISQLVVSAPLHQKHNSPLMDTYIWHDMADKLLKIKDQEFAIALTRQMLFSCKFELSYDDLFSYIKPLLINLMYSYGDILWPIFGEAIIQAKKMERYWLQQLLERDEGVSFNSPSVFSALSVESVVDWCFENPDIGPEFVASCLDILEYQDNDKTPSSLFIALLIRFGDDKYVKSSLNANMGTRGFSGSLVPYLESEKIAFTPLIDHENINVRTWVSEYITYLDKQIEHESSRDGERDLGVYF